MIYVVRLNYIKKLKKKKELVGDVFRLLRL